MPLQRLGQNRRERTGLPSPSPATRERDRRASLSRARFARVARARPARLPRALSGRTAVIGLFDAYADLLTERQRVLLQMYYHDDLSLGEIAVDVGVTRQAVFDSLRRSVAEMRHFEARLGVAADRDRTVRSRMKQSGRLQAVEREAARLAEAAAADVGRLMRALRALRESL